LFSMLYAQQLNEKSEYEIALHYTSVQIFFPERNVFIAPSNLPHGISTAWQADVTWRVQPFEGTLQSLRLGIGPSVQFWSRILTQPSVATPALPSGSPPIPFQTTYRNRTSFAIHGKAEWLLLQLSQYDIAIRAQMHLFADPLSGATDFPTVGGMGSLGFFLSLHF
jgi:hypothetical protein